MLVSSAKSPGVTAVLLHNSGGEDQCYTRDIVTSHEQKILGLGTSGEERGNRRTRGGQTLLS